MIVRDKTSIKEMGSMVKVVVDISKNILAVGCELHVDCEEELLKDGSSQKNLWGANVYPQDMKIDFVSMINIRPQEGNRTMEIQIPEVRARVEEIIRRFLSNE